MLHRGSTLGHFPLPLGCLLALAGGSLFSLPQRRLFLLLGGIISLPGSLIAPALTVELGPISTLVVRGA